VDAVAELTIFGKIVLAAFLGFLIGLEREYRGKPAGDRTFALLAMGSAAFVAVAVELFALTADRAIQGVAAGVGFLGAGIIFRENRGDGEPHGLTTAAASWTAAAIGVLTGTGDFLAACLTTALVVLVLETQYMPYVRRLGGRRREPPPDEGG
jgi:putative Mg2+ transporter-C (MgtC) family protein